MARRLASQDYSPGRMRREDIAVTDQQYARARKKVVAKTWREMHRCEGLDFNGTDSYYLINGGVVELYETRGEKRLTLQHETKSGLAALARHLGLPKPAR